MDKVDATQQLQNLREEVESYLRTADFRLERLLGGASARSFYKLHFSAPHYFPKEDVLLVTFPTDKPQMLEDYINIGYYFDRHGLPAPKAYELVSERHWLFVEYLQMPTVEHAVMSGKISSSHAAELMTTFILKMQKICKPEAHCAAFRRRFDYEKYQFEFDFHMKEQLLAGYFRQQELPAHLIDFAEEISRQLDIKEDLFVHRDFQSSNVLVDDSHQLFVVDFQDARSGSPVYDLVACLWDSYIPVASEVREKMVNNFYQRLSENYTTAPSIELFKIWVDYSAIQRKIHDAGAFAYNFARTGDKRYVKYIRPAMEMAIERMGPYPKLNATAAYFRELVYQ